MAQLGLRADLALVLSLVLGNHRPGKVERYRFPDLYETINKINSLDLKCPAERVFLVDGGDPGVGDEDLLVHGQDVSVLHSNPGNLRNEAKLCKCRVNIFE